jgi:hypothetical protein
LFDLPAGVLFEPTVGAALRAAIAQARSPACFIGDVVLKIALGRGTPTARPGAGGVPDLGQVAELDAGVVALGREPVITLTGGDRVQGDQQVRLPGGPGGEPPAAVSARRAVLAGGREGEPGSGPRPGRAAFVPVSVVSLGLGAGAAVADGVSLLIGHGHAIRGSRVAGGGVGEVAGQVGVDGSDLSNSRGWGGPDLPNSGRHAAVYLCVCLYVANGSSHQQFGLVVHGGSVSPCRICARGHHRTEQSTPCADYPSWTPSSIHHQPHFQTIQSALMVESKSGLPRIGGFPG